MADDMGYECVASNGGEGYETPNLDALAAEGVRFTNCYSTPLCTPSRVQIMTGRYNQRNYEHFGWMNPAEITFGQMMQDAGYVTAVCGKWQLRGSTEMMPREFGFDEHCLWQFTHVGSELGSRYWAPQYEVNGESRNGGDDIYGPDVYCQYLLDFLERNKDGPFFAYYPMCLPHDPYVRTPNSPPGQERAVYFRDMVAYVDELVGRIVGKLNDLGIHDDTILLFTADNGTGRSISSVFEGRTLQGGKGTPTHRGTHVPFVASWKGQSPEGSVVHDLIDFTDFFRTLAEAGGGSVPTDRIVDGSSFLPHITGQGDRERPWVFCDFNNVDRAWLTPGRFAHDRRYKLYDEKYADSNPRAGLFFDLQSEPDEANPIEPGNEIADERAARAALQYVLDNIDSGAINMENGGG